MYYFWQSKVKILFISILVLTVALNLSFDYLFINEQLYFNTFSEQLSSGKIESIFSMGKKYGWVSFLLIPLFLLIRIFFTSTFLYIGTYFSEIKIDFSKLFKVALIADFIYILSGVVKLLVLVLFKNVSTLQDLQYTPLSIMSLFDVNAVDPVFAYSLSLLNVFELFYFLTLAALLVIAIKESKQLQPIKYGKSLQLVTSSYGSGLLIWVLLVMFVSLNMS